jgi:exodeoxyribonuclease VII small subunit
VSDELNYKSAAAELESILAELESSAVDVDQLSTRLGRASELVQFCKDRLQVVEGDVNQVLDDLGPNSEGSDA